MLATQARAILWWNGRFRFDLPDEYLAQRLTRGRWVMDPEDWARAHEELHRRLDDLRRCPQCDRFLLAAHDRQEFDTPTCRRTFHRYLTEFRATLRDAKRRRDRAAVARLTAAIARQERLAVPMKRKTT